MGETQLGRYKVNPSRYLHLWFCCCFEAHLILKLAKDIKFMTVRLECGLLWRKSRRSTASPKNQGTSGIWQVLYYESVSPEFFRLWDFGRLGFTALAFTVAFAIASLCT